MKKLPAFLMSLTLIIGFTLHAQKIVLKEGSFDFLKGQTSLLVTFDYSDMAVGKYDHEEDYIEKKVTDYNESEPGRGDIWKEAWQADRADRYEPKFLLLFNEYISKIGIVGSKTTTDAQYEMNIHTVFTEPGFNIGIARKSALIDVIIKWKNIATGEQVAEITVDNCPGRDAMGYDFDTGYRIEEAYAKLGKSVAGYLLKKH